MFDTSSISKIYDKIKKKIRKEQVKSLGLKK